MAKLIVLCAALAAGVGIGLPLAQAGTFNSPQPDTIAPDLKIYTSPYYYLHTDLPEDTAREAVLRMTRMFEEYHQRTAMLFTGQINERLPFYLFSREEDYLRAGGMPKTAGIFDGTKLMAVADITGPDHIIGPGTWHVVQHEGFHQFVAALMRGQIPVWVNEGLAEYFGEALFTGDSMVAGIIPAYRLQRVQQEIRENKFKPIREMMLMSHDRWNGDMLLTNYDQAWSMVHFLATAEDGKYQTAFAQFLQLVGRAWPWESAWKKSFGSAEGFEEKWKDYWLKLPENPTLNLYAKVDVATLTSFMGRAASQHQQFDDLPALFATDPASLKCDPQDWLPPRLFTQAKDLNRQLQRRGAKFFMRRLERTQLPQIVCDLPDGTKVIGTFQLTGGRISRVQADIVKPLTTNVSAPKN